ncbi:MAG: hypothetical protein AAF297_11410 [Planctomycetota bacterium]
MPQPPYSTRVRALTAIDIDQAGTLTTDEVVLNDPANKQPATRSNATQ